MTSSYKEGVELTFNCMTEGSESPFRLHPIHLLPHTQIDMDTHTLKTIVAPNRPFSIILPLFQSWTYEKTLSQYVKPVDKIERPHKYMKKVYIYKPRSLGILCKGNKYKLSLIN